MGVDVVIMEENWTLKDVCEACWGKVACVFIFFIPLGLYFFVETIRVIRLHNQPINTGSILESIPWRNWAGWHFVRIRVQRDDGRIGIGEVDQNTAIKLEQRVQFHWSGSPSDEILIHNPKEMHPALTPGLAVLFLWGTPTFLGWVFHMAGAFPPTQHLRPKCYV